MRNPVTDKLIPERVVGRGHGRSAVGAPMTPGSVVEYSRVVFATRNDEAVMYFVVENDWY